MHQKKAPRENSKIVEFFHRHLVPIHFTFSKGDKSHSGVMSTFLIEVSGEWLLITAGHCLEEINKNTNELGFSISNCRLIDSMGVGATHSDPIPFDFEEALPWVTSNISDYDYGVLYLRDNYKALLRANNVVPFNETTWKNQPSDPDFFAVMGVPHSLTVSDGKIASIATTLHYLEREADRPGGFDEKKAPMFYAKIQLGEDLMDIEGLSGGPILSFKEDPDGKLRYWLHAVQSTWLPQSRYISAVQIKPLGLFLTEVIEGKHNDLLGSE